MPRRMAVQCHHSKELIPFTIGPRPLIGFGAKIFTKLNLRDVYHHVTNLQSTERREPIECKQRELSRSVREEQEFQGHVRSTERTDQKSVVLVLSRLIESQ